MMVQSKGVVNRLNEVVAADKFFSDTPVQIFSCVKSKLTETFPMNIKDQFPGYTY